MKNNTLAYYNKNAQEYFDKTINGNMNKAYHLFISCLKSNDNILDLGCGSGRDSKYFIEQGYNITAIDGSKEMCKIASTYINQEVYNITFDELNTNKKYNGIWACATLLHINKSEFINTLNKLYSILVDDGILYISLKNGDNNEIVDNKFYQYYTKDELDKIFADNNFRIKEYFIATSSTNKDEDRYWHNYILKKQI